MICMMSSGVAAASVGSELTPMAANCIVLTVPMPTTAANGLDGTPAVPSADVAGGKCSECSTDEECDGGRCVMRGCAAFVPWPPKLTDFVPQTEHTSTDAGWPAFENAGVDSETG